MAILVRHTYYARLRVRGSPDFDGVVSPSTVAVAATAGRYSGGGTAAINGIIELHRRLTTVTASGDNYRLLMLLADSGPTA
ncbi:hypothetical protein ACTHQS_09915 [Arthrobacter sp. SAFR-044]